MKKISNIYFYFLLFCVCSSWIPPETPSGEEEFLNGEYFQAFLIWEKRALNGDHIAMYRIAMLYYRGLGVKQSYEDAFKWYRVSALSDNAQAMYRVGLLYLKGEGVEASCKQAIDWIKKSAEEGDERAILQLGKMYYQGKCTEKNLHKALSLFKDYLLAMKDGNFKFSIDLGEEPKDFFSEREKVRLLVSEILYDLGYFYFIGKDVEKAVSYWESAAKEGNAHSLFALGLLHHNALLGKVSFHIAYEYYYWSALEGGLEAIKVLRERSIENIALAQYRLGLLYLDADKEGRENLNVFLKDLEEEDFLFNKIIMPRDPQLHTNLEKGRELLRLAAVQGLVEAQYDLAVLYTSEKEIEHSDVMAFQWYFMAANQRHMDAQFSLGLMYKGGVGVKRDPVMAHVWLNHAMSSGHRNAELEILWLERDMPEDEIILAKRLAEEWIPYRSYEKSAVSLNRMRKAKE